MSDYVSYVYSITSEINLHAILGRLLRRISKFGTKHIDKHRPMFCIIIIQALAIGL